MYDREQQATLQGQVRGLGLMGDFQNSKNWSGGQIQQIVRLLPDGSLPIPEMKLPKIANFDVSSVRAALAMKFLLCGRVFVPIDVKDRNVYLMETNVGTCIIN
ncbi:hypothetical protein DENSPDRAFT_880144 [Dentipellis sp. KUC8613]|nr:hypothetical protein DENSPDRAFT_880144 [Dentipellis sp. KUC8613]